MSRVDLYFLLQNLDIPLLRFYDNLVRKENTFDNRIMSKNASSNISKFSLMRQSFNKCVASRRTPILVSTELAQHVCIGGYNSQRPVKDMVPEEEESVYQSKYIGS